MLSHPCRAAGPFLQPGTAQCPAVPSLPHCSFPIAHLDKCFRKTNSPFCFSPLCLSCTLPHPTASQRVPRTTPVPLGAAGVPTAAQPRSCPHHATRAVTASCHPAPQGSLPSPRRAIELKCWLLAEQGKLLLSSSSPGNAALGGPTLGPPHAGGVLQLHMAGGNVTHFVFNSQTPPPPWDMAFFFSFFFPLSLYSRAQISSERAHRLFVTPACCGGGGAAPGGNPGAARGF